MDTLAEYESLHAGCDRALAEDEIGSKCLREPTRVLLASTRLLLEVYKKTRFAIIAYLNSFGKAMGRILLSLIDSPKVTELISEL